MDVNFDQTDSMNLHSLKPNVGAKHPRKRLGLGESSGHGKTSGRGGKGQTARSGSSIRIGFEGGQMPLFRRIPKRGFSNARFRTEYFPLNFDMLEAFPDGAQVDRSKLEEAGIIRKSTGKIKLLARGKLTKRLNVVADAYSAQAKKEIERLGGGVSLINQA